MITNGTTINYYNVNDTSRWILGQSNFFFNGASYFLGNETSNVHFDILSDTIRLPYATFTAVTRAL
jgi:hypothetical protein